MIHMTQAATLTYPAAACGLAASQSAPESPPADCPATATAHFTHYFGQVLADDMPLAPGVEIRARSPRGEVVGCAQIREDGIYPYLRVYGAEDDLPGMRPGEAIRFEIGDQPVVTSSPVIWRNDYDVHALDLYGAAQHTYLPLVDQ